MYGSWAPKLEKRFTGGGRVPKYMRDCYWTLPSFEIKPYRLTTDVDGSTLKRYLQIVELDFTLVWNSRGVGC